MKGQLKVYPAPAEATANPDYRVRVLQNEKYNPHPGQAVRNIEFDNINFDGECPNPSVIEGYDESRTVDGVVFRNLRINGRTVRSAEEGHFVIGQHAHHVVFEKGGLL